MLSTKPYEAAEAFETAGLWDALYDDDLFAVRFADGTNGYCCVMGHEGQHYALTLYLGEAALGTYFALQHLDEDADSLRVFQTLHGQDCLSCSFELANELEEQDVAEMKKQGMSPESRERWPVFRRYRPGKLPWHITEAEEWDKLCLALEAGVALRGRVAQAMRMANGAADTKSGREKAMAALGFSQTSIPLLTPQGDGAFGYDVLPLPEDFPIRYNSPVLEEPFLVARLKKQKVLPNTAWVCDLMMLPTPVDGEPPFFPTAMMILDAEEGFLDASMVADFEEEGAGLLDKLIDMMLEKGKPSVLLTDDMRTYILLKGVAEQIQLNLSLEEGLSGMEEVRLDFMNFLMGGEEPPEDAVE